MATMNSVKTRHGYIITGVTHEGAPAAITTPEQELRRSVMACMLWENTFYESGITIADRIKLLVASVPAETVADIAIEAREQMKLRHVPLLLVASMAKLPSHKHVVAATLERVIQRPDELCEYLAIYLNGKPRQEEPINHQSLRGLRRAFGKFNEYSLAKYNRDGLFKLRDVLRLCRPKPRDEEQSDLWKRLLSGNLVTPDTWEVELSQSKDKLASWTRLLSEDKLGAMALLRNLRNLQSCGVDPGLVSASLAKCDPSRVLPFRFIAAARYAPQFEPQLESLLFGCCESMPKLTGKTIVLVDVSFSMESGLSDKSDMKRADAACGLAMVAREVCESVRVFSFSDRIVEVPPRRGFALRDAIVSSQSHSGTNLGDAVAFTNKIPHDRLIVITDEQSSQPVSGPRGKGYMLNVASYENGVGYGPWVRLDGFSEAIIGYIAAMEDGSEVSSILEELSDDQQS